MAWDEDSLHRWLLRTPPRGLAGAAGHDAAVLRAFAGRPVQCVDQTVEKVHFESDAPPARVGRKAACRALSDLAATAAIPRALFLALSAPRQREERWLRALIGGVRRAAREHGADLAGGDLCASPGPVVIGVTALGELPGRRRPPARDAARAGQRLLVTGQLGGSLLGRHMTFEPRLAEGRALYARGATAMMDVSDGLAWDLFRLARRSGVRLDVDADCVPLHAAARRAARTSGRAPLWHALHDGEDYELVATLPARAAARALADARRFCPGLAAIGRVRRGRGLWLCGEDGGTRRWQAREGGFRHGA